MVWEIGRVVYFVVQDVVKEDFEGVREVGEVGVVVGEIERGGGVVLADVVAEDLGEEEVRLFIHMSMSVLDRSGQSPI